jgi:recombination protein RecA
MRRKRKVGNPNLKAALKEINDKYGEGTIVRLGDSKMLEVPRMLTGVGPIDEMLGGGLPQGSIVELYGEPSGGKSTLAQIIISMLQKRGGEAAYLDAEHGLDDKWMRRFGINIEDLIWSQPETAEEALDSTLALIKADIDLIVVDSVAAMVPREELEGVAEEGMGDKKMGVKARLMAKAIRVMLSALKGKKTVVLFINQFTTDIGAMRSFYGSPSSTHGGKMLKQQARVRLEIIRTEWLTSDLAKKAGAFQGRYGAKLEVRVMKSKVSPPFRYCTLILNFYTKAELAKIGIGRKKGGNR